MQVEIRDWRRPNNKEKCGEGKDKEKEWLGGGKLHLKLYKNNKQTTKSTTTYATKKNKEVIENVTENYFEG